MSAEDTIEIVLVDNVWKQITDGTGNAHIQESLSGGHSPVSWCHSAEEPTESTGKALLRVEKTFGPPLVVWVRAVNGRVSVTKWQ